MVWYEQKFLWLYSLLIVLVYKSKSITKCCLEGASRLLKWYNNWTTKQPLHDNDHK